MIDATTEQTPVEQMFQAMEREVLLGIAQNPHLIEHGVTIDDLIILVMCQCKSFVMMQSAGKDALAWILYLGCNPINNIAAVKRELQEVYDKAKTDAERDNVIQVVTGFCNVFCDKAMVKFAHAWGMIPAPAEA